MRRRCEERGLYRSSRLYGDVATVTTEGKEVQKVLRSMPGRERLHQLSRLAGEKGELVRWMGFGGVNVGRREKGKRKPGFLKL